MKIIAANWKLHKNPQQTRDFFGEWKKNYQTQAGRKVVFFPASTCLEAASHSVLGQDYEFGSQNCYFENQGAFTGEISAQTVKDMNGQWVLIGHSERRKLFGESDSLLSQKVACVQALGLTPMFCIGETLDERESGQTQLVLKTQLEKGLSKADKNKKLVVAYEPVWAIGTGKVATPEQVQETHLQCYQMLTALGFSKETPILYGGSVKADNAKGLIQIPHVDGFLVGGASLEVKSFWDICRVV